MKMKRPPEKSDSEPDGKDTPTLTPLADRGFDNPNFKSIATALDKALDQDWVATSDPEHDENKEEWDTLGVGRIAGGEKSIGVLLDLRNPNFKGISMETADPHSAPPPLPATPTLEPADDELDDDLLQKIADLEADKAHAVHSKEMDLGRVSSHTREYLRQIGARRGNLPFKKGEICLICVAKDGRYFVEIVAFEQETDNLFHTIIELGETIFNLAYVIRRSGRMIRARKATFYISAVTARLAAENYPQGRIVAVATNVGCIYVDQAVPGLKDEIEQLIRFRQGQGEVA